METENKTIFHALNGILQDVNAIGKNKTNISQGYKFRGIDDMYNALQPIFKKHSVFITSNVLNSKREERQTKSGGVLIYTIATIEFRFFTIDGSSVTSIIEGEAMDSGDKSTNKAMSTALKYALMQMFLIPTEEQLDTEYHTHEVTPIEAAKEIGKALSKAKDKKEPQQPVNEVDILVRKTYEKDEDLLMILDSCETIAQITNLYHCNPKLVSDIKVREQFTKQKELVTKNK